MTTALADPFASLKASEREHWASFAGAAIFSTVPAAKLVRFAQVSPGQRVLDVACGTGVVAVTAARRGAKVSGLDLSPDLLQRARENAATAGVEVDFLEGDTEALPYPDATFNIVLSRFGHIFAPRPELAVREMVAGPMKGSAKSGKCLPARQSFLPHFVSLMRATIDGLIGHQAEAQFRRAQELDDITLTPPTRDLRERRQQTVVAGLPLRLALRRRSLVGNDGDRILVDVDLPACARAPKLDRGRAVFGDLDDRHALGAAHRRHVEHEITGKREGLLAGEGWQSERHDQTGAKEAGETLARASH
jgi:SAM-dependent methyltransferase